MTLPTDHGHALPTEPGQEPDLFRTLFESAPDKMVVITPGEYRVVAVTNSYLSATHTTREQLVGERLFDVFLDDPTDPDPEGSRLLKESLYRVETLGTEDIMAPQRYPVRRNSPRGDYYEERYWSVVNAPILDEQGNVRYIINRAEDITALMTVDDPDGDTNQIKESESATAKRQALELEVVLRDRELKDAHSRLHAQESSLRAAQRLLGLGLWRINLDSGAVDISDSTRALLGIAADAPNPLEELLYNRSKADNRDDARQQFQDWLRSPPAQIEFRHQITLPNGKIQHLHGTGELTQSPEGRFITGVVQDVTREIEIAASLSSAENLQRIAGRIARLGGWRIDLRTGVSHWSDELWDIYELERGSRIPMSHLFLPADRERLRSRYDDCCNHAHPYDEVFQLTTPRGHHRWVRILAEPELDDTGEVISVHGAVLDVTQQKLQEQILRERVKELDCLHRTSLILSNPDTDTRQLLGELADIIPPAMLYHHHAVARLGLDNEEFRSRNWQEPVIAIRADIIHNNQAVGWVEGGYPQTHHEDPPRQIMFLDEERQMLQAIARQIGQVLDNREAIRQLTQAQRMEAIGQLTGGVAHDFNNLLTVILGNAEMLTETLQHQPELTRLTRMVTQAADRGAELTNRLLAFARRQALAPQSVAVTALVTELAPLLHRTLTGNIEIEIQCAPDLWQAEVDPVQLETALLNLTLNARDAMPDGGRLTIEAHNTHLDVAYTRLHEDLTPGDYVVLAVTDTGAGMTPEVRHHAFEPFFTTKRASEGSGLGLSMVYGFLKQSGGHVRIYSEPGEGTTVRLYLPRNNAPAGTANRHPEPAIPRGKQEHILVVEDDELVRTHVLGVLESLDYRVSSARAGPEALQRLQDLKDVDLLFTDIIMPGGLNGPELARTALARHPQLKVLYTSGYTENAIVHHGRLDPGVLLLSKPYRSQDLALKIRNALDS